MKILDKCRFFGKIIAKLSLFDLHVRVIKNKHYLNGVAAIIKYAERSEGDFCPKECLFILVKATHCRLFSCIVKRRQKNKIRFFLLTDQQKPRNIATNN